MMKYGLLLLLTLLCPLVRAQKLIELGWDALTPAMLQQHLAEVEQRPFDGVAVHITGRDDRGVPVTLTWAHSRTAMKREWFEESVTILKNLPFQRLTDNFVNLGANPGEVDWFDDPGWEIIAGNWRVAAGIARDSGFKGIMFDPEAYCEGYGQFKYICQPEQARHTFEQYLEQARKRGRQVMKAVAETYPDITIFVLFLYSYNMGYQPDARGWYSDTGLQAAFFDGMLDEAPPETVFIDGDESSYSYSSDRQYAQARLEVEQRALQYVAPENHARYRAQVRYAPAFYLDNYLALEGVRPKPLYGQSPAERFYQNLVSAAGYSDGYIWVYGERYRWWPTAKPEVSARSWPEVFPGCDTALEMAIKPQEFIRRWFGLEKHAAAADLVHNGDFGKAVTAEGSSLPAGWDVEVFPPWQSAAAIRLRAGKLEFSGAWSYVGLTQNQTVKTGERYAVRAKLEKTGWGGGMVKFCWRTPEGIPLHRNLDAVFRPDEAGWIYGLASVPEGAAELQLQLGVEGQRLGEWEDRDRVRFDGVELYRLPALP